MSTYYKDIVITTYIAKNENSSSKVRAYPLSGQGFPEDLNVECSKSMRSNYPVGTKFKVRAKITDREGTLFIYSDYRKDYTVMSDKEAADFINSASSV